MSPPSLSQTHSVGRNERVVEGERERAMETLKSKTGKKGREWMIEERN